MPIKRGTVAEFEALGFPKKTYVIGMPLRTASGNSSPDNLSQQSGKASTEPSSPSKEPLPPQADKPQK